MILNKKKNPDLLRSRKEGRELFSISYKDTHNEDGELVEEVDNDNEYHVNAPEGTSSKRETFLSEIILQRQSALQKSTPNLATPKNNKHEKSLNSKEDSEQLFSEQFSPIKGNPNNDQNTFVQSNLYLKTPRDTVQSGISQDLTFNEPKNNKPQSNQMFISIYPESNSQMQKNASEAPENLKLSRVQEDTNENQDTPAQQVYKNPVLNRVMSINVNLKDDSPLSAASIKKASLAKQKSQFNEEFDQANNLTNSDYNPSITQSSGGLLYSNTPELTPNYSAVSRNQKDPIIERTKSNNQKDFAPKHSSTSNNQKDNTPKHTSTSNNQKDFALKLTTSSNYQKDNTPKHTAAVKDEKAFKLNYNSETPSHFSRMNQEVNKIQTINSEEEEEPSPKKIIKKRIKIKTEFIIPLKTPIIFPHRFRTKLKFTNFILQDVSPQNNLLSSAKWIKILRSQEKNILTYSILYTNLRYGIPAEIRPRIWNFLMMRQNYNAKVNQILNYLTKNNY